ncbi:uncharacterized protein LOC109834266 [Asparagus officinalis]|uniref:uncharacterized protein LOC109834266 n=1 Tax=Asparagus officinalis TaxID=4686 RepID=UPI00098E5995|nr:uncharacterized protein LOC109834266 [Asparagus officinalis]
MRILAYEASADSVDDSMRIRESTAIDSLSRFIKVIVVIFGDEYLRSPTDEDTARLLAIGKQHGHGLTVNYIVNSHEYTMGYYLADGIYPSWLTFVKTISLPQGNKRKNFATLHESAKKDVERAFGVLQSCFAIVHGPARSWDEKILKNIMQACIIMHNMIVEDERNDDYIDFAYDAAEEAPTISVSHEHTINLCEFIQNHHHIGGMQTHSQLQLDLVENLWQRNGGL